MPVLSRTQQNDVYKLVAAAGLKPANFDLTSEEQSYRGLVERFTHRPTNSRIDFSLGDSGDFWVSWWPRFRGAGDSFFARGWGQTYDAIGQWAAAVRSSDEAPDLWAEASKAHELSDAAGHVEGDNTPFDLAEIELIKPKLDELEAYIESRQALDVDQKRELRGRFQYLLGAAKRGLGRIDWLNILVSQITQLFTNGVLHSALYGDVMRHATTVLGRVIKHGVRMIGGS